MVRVMPGPILELARHRPQVLPPAANNAAAVVTAHSMLLEKHCKMFLQRAIGINPNGTPIQDQTLLPEKSKKYKSGKTVVQYQDIIQYLSN
jgi:hypothetical protein